MAAQDGFAIIWFPLTIRFASPVCLHRRVKRAIVSALIINMTRLLASRHLAYLFTDDRCFIRWIRFAANSTSRITQEFAEFQADKSQDQSTVHMLYKSCGVLSGKVWRMLAKMFPKNAVVHIYCGKRVVYEFVAVAIPPASLMTLYDPRLM